MIIYLITSILWILLSGYSQVLINMGNLFEKIQGVNYSNYANICMLVAIILQIVIAFSMKNILKEFSENNGSPYFSPKPDIFFCQGKRYYKKLKKVYLNNS